MKQFFRSPNPGATAEEIAALEAGLSHRLPAAYAAFLREANGAAQGVHDRVEGEKLWYGDFHLDNRGGDHLRLWSAAEVLAEDEYGLCQGRVCGHLSIGADGRGGIIILEKKAAADPEEWPVSRVDFGMIGMKYHHVQAPTFAEWARREFRLTDPDPDGNLYSERQWTT